MNETTLDKCIYLDVAILCKEYSPIELNSNHNHVIELDEIPISEQLFKYLFYPHGETYGLNENVCSQSFPYITFLYPYRTQCGKPFSLYESILTNIEEDLGISRNCILTKSLIDLTNDLANIKTLTDLNCCDVINSLTWSNIYSIIRNNYIISNNTINNAILMISVVFKSPNCQIHPTIIKFKYRININSNWMII
jgi:hypothetical protein